MQRMLVVFDEANTSRRTSIGGGHLVPINNLRADEADRKSSSKPLPNSRADTPEIVNDNFHPGRGRGVVIGFVEEFGMAQHRGHPGVEGSDHLLFFLSGKLELNIYHHRSWVFGLSQPQVTDFAELRIKVGFWCKATWYKRQQAEKGNMQVRTPKV